MRRNILAILGVMVSIAMFVGVGALIAADAPDEIAIKSKAFETYKKAAVNLSHKKHAVDYKIACSECHHVYKEGKNVFKEGDPVQECSACHDPDKSEGKKVKLMLAFHKNCQGCHKDLQKASKPAGPTTKCNDCHAKE
jgi:predicted CXXCH cytochrome family protein